MLESKNQNAAIAMGFPKNDIVKNDGSEYLSYAQRLSGEQPKKESRPFLAADDKMSRIQVIIEQIANANVPVLISGESGVGKEVIARNIHEKSQRSQKPFVAINCAAIPMNLLEGELFGFEKGSFTGATSRHLGKFEQANHGTLLLDEVTEMEPALQAKLLRALQEKEIERVGGSGPVPVDVRIIATTNRDIISCVESGKFRQDLYYRLHVINIEIPPLRDRKRDIDLLANHFLQLFGAQFGKHQLSFSSDALKKLNQYEWPGNVRELQNVIQRVALLCSHSVISAAEIPIEGNVDTVQDIWVHNLPIGRTLHDLETNFILETLKHHHGNRTHAAKTLGISLRTLRNKINEFSSLGLDVPTPSLGRAS